MSKFCLLIGRVVVWCCSFLCLFVCLFAKYALRVPPVVTRLTVYRRLRVFFFSQCQQKFKNTAQKSSTNMPSRMGAYAKTSPWLTPYYSFQSTRICSTSHKTTLNDSQSIPVSLCHRNWQRGVRSTLLQCQMRRKVEETTTKIEMPGTKKTESKRKQFGLIKVAQ